MMLVSLSIVPVSYYIKRICIQVSLYISIFSGSSSHWSDRRHKMPGDWLCRGDRPVLREPRVEGTKQHAEPKHAVGICWKEFGVLRVRISADIYTSATFFP